MKNRYELLKDIVLNVDEVKKHLRISENHIYSMVLNLRMRLRKQENLSVESIIDCIGVGKNDVSFASRVYDFAQKEIEKNKLI